MPLISPKSAAPAKVVVVRTPGSARVPPDPLFANEITFIQTRRADEGVGCAPGGPPHQNKSFVGSGGAGGFACRILFLFLSLTAPMSAATFGTVVASGAAYSDIVLDQARSQLYLVTNASNQIAVWSLKQNVFLNPIATDAQPVAAAISPDGNHLYVTSYATAALDVIDLNAGILTSRISLPSSPEGVAVGGDGTVLITAVPVTAGSTSNTLLVYNPAATASQSVVTSVPVVPPAPTPATLPPPSGRIFNSYTSRLIATADGKYIIGADGISTTGSVVFVYEVSSGTVLRSRAVTNLSNTLSVSPDGTEFMAGSTLFNTQTLQVIGQENAANAPFPFPAGTAGNFNIEANQGGSIFSPDGVTLYAAFNMAPSGAARPNVTQLLYNDPADLLITLGLQLPENLVGKMVIDSTGANIYALSDSGFTILPVGSTSNSPLAQPASRVVLLVNDACQVYASRKTAADVVGNTGKGRFTATVTAAPTTLTLNFPGIIGIPGIGGPGGIGGGTITITIPGTNLPLTSVTNTATGATMNFAFNPGAAANPGTLGPSDFIVTSPEAINIPGNVHVYQNNRTPESAGAIMPLAINASAGEGLTDILMDSTRRRLYIANSGMNRVEVFDLTTGQFLAPIKVGQLPHGMALAQDGVTLYVANTGGESIGIVNLDQMVQTGSVVFPALPFNASVTLITPRAIAASIRGPLVVMSDGSLWDVIGTRAAPRILNPAIFGATATTVSGGNPAFWSMAATPGGENILLLAGTGNAYLYNDALDDFTLVKQVLSTPLTGYVGPVTAGPKGAWYGVGGTILNASLSQVGGGTNSLSASGREVGAVAAVSPTQIAQFTVPVRASATATVTDAGQIEMYNPVTGLPQGAAAPTVEGPPSTITGNTRTAAFARSLAVDTVGQNAYALTASGLSIIPLQSTANAASRPSVNPGGVVNLADYTSPVAPGGLVSIFGRNLGATTSAGAPLPSVMGGTCVTLNNQPLPLALVSPGQINAQIPVGMAAGRYPLIVRSISNNVTSLSSAVTVSTYAPAVLMGEGGQAAIFHSDGSYVTSDNPANRDETLIVFATGLGPTHGATILSGQPAPTSPLAVTNAVSVFFGNPLYKQAAIIVDWSGLAPGLVGVYQINVTVPGFHISGSSLPVTLKVAGVSSSTTGPDPPTISVN